MDIKEEKVWVSGDKIYMHLRRGRGDMPGAASFAMLATLIMIFPGIFLASLVWNVGFVGGALPEIAASYWLIAFILVLSVCVAMMIQSYMAGFIEVTINLGSTRLKGAGVNIAYDKVKRIHPTELIRMRGLLLLLVAFYAGIFALVRYLLGGLLPVLKAPIYEHAFSVKVNMQQLGGCFYRQEVAAQLAEMITEQVERRKASKVFV